MKAFDHLPDSARLWIFAASAPIPAQNRTAFTAELEAALRAWKSHGTPVRSGYDIRYDRFVLIAADVEGESPSGCSIDSLVRAVPDVGAKQNIQLLDSSAHVYFRDGSGIHSAGREEFAALCENGAVSGTTPVFNNAIHTLRELRDGKWELPFSGSWHAQVFRVAA